MVWALVAALLAAAGYAVASILEAIGARAGGSVLNVLRQPTYLAGQAVDLLAWALSLLALRTLAVYQVQAILAGSLAATALLARVFLSVRLRRTDLIAIAVSILALVVIAASAGAQSDAAPSRPVRIGIVTAAVVIALLGWWASRRGRAGACAVLAGLAFGGTALCARGLPLSGHPLHSPALLARELLTDPLSYALVGFGVAGTLLYAQALRRGAVGPMTALLWISEVVLPAIAGIALLGDRIRPGWTAPTLAALAVSVAATSVLALSPATATASPE